jgi:hypothetical protein
MFGNITSSGERRFNFPTKSIPYCYVQDNGENIAFDVDAQQYEIHRNVEATKSMLPHLVKLDVGDDIESPFFKLASALQLHFNDQIPMEFHFNNWVYLKTNDNVLHQLEAFTMNGSTPHLMFSILVKHVLLTPNEPHRIKCVLTGVHELTAEQKTLAAELRRMVTPPVKGKRQPAVRRKQEPAAKKMKAVNVEGAEVEPTELDSQIASILDSFPANVN